MSMPQTGGMMFDFFFDWLVVLIPLRWLLIGLGVLALLILALGYWAMHS